MKQLCCFDVLNFAFRSSAVHLPILFIMHHYTSDKTAYATITHHGGINVAQESPTCLGVSVFFIMMTFRSCCLAAKEKQDINPNVFLLSNSVLSSGPQEMVTCQRGWAAVGPGPGGRRTVALPAAPGCAWQKLLCPFCYLKRRSGDAVTL